MGGQAARRRLGQRERTATDLRQGLGRAVETCGGMNHHTTRAVLALTATLAALAIAAPAHAAEHPSGPTTHTAAPAQPVPDALDTEDNREHHRNGPRPPHRHAPGSLSPTPGGLIVPTGSGGQFHQAYPGTVPGYSPYFGGFRPF